MWVREMFGVDRGAVTPALEGLFNEVDYLTVRGDTGQRKYMSINSYCMFGAKRINPETLPSTVRLTSNYNKATDGDMTKAIRVAQYIYGNREEHRMVLAPKRLQLIASSDASYAEHSDGESHTGGCVDFDSDRSC